MHMNKIVQTALLCFVVSALDLGAEDLKITYKTVDSIISADGDGRNTRIDKQVDYHSERYMRSNGEKEKKDTLVDYKENVSYEIDHKNMVINMTTIEDVQKAMDLMAAKLKELKEGIGSAKSDKQTELLMSLLGDDGGAKANAKNKGKEKVAGRACEKWDVSVEQFTARVSADPSLLSPAPADALERAQKLEIGEMLMMFPGSFRVFFDEVSKIKGIPLKLDMVIPLGPITMRSSRQATEVVVGPIPATVFELPKGYKQLNAGQENLKQLEKALAEIQAKKK
jgi:hypothetical protein